MNKNLTVIQAENEEPISTELLAQSIKKIADGFEKLRASGLTHRAIVVLVSNASKVNRNDVSQVLNGIDVLGKLYLKNYNRGR